MSLVSLIIPARNRHTLAQLTIKSAFAQIHSDIEVVLVDNGSVPPFQREDFTQFLSGSQRERFHLLSQPSGNANAARNAGLDHSRGSFVLFLDSDDLLTPSCVATRLEHLQQDATLHAVVGRCEYFKAAPGDHPGKFWGDWDTPFTDLECFLGAGRDPWQTAGPLWRRSFLEAKSLRWDEAINKAQDWEFHTRALTSGLNYIKTPSVDHYWRCDPDGAQMSSPQSQAASLARGDILHSLAVMFRTAMAVGYLSPGSARLSPRLRGMRRLLLQNLREARASGLSFQHCLRHLRHHAQTGVLNRGMAVELACYLIAWNQPRAGRLGRSLFYRRYKRALSRPAPSHA